MYPDFHSAGGKTIPEKQVPSAGEKTLDLRKIMQFWKSRKGLMSICSLSLLDEVPCECLGAERDADELS